MSDWLVHFTRQVNGRPAREVLRTILVEGVLRPGFAPRGRSMRPTIYGPTSAVCFSEQPIAAYINYLDARREPWGMSGYGLLLHKHDVFVAGGLPVIYGLDHCVELNEGDDGYDPQRRLLDPTRLPYEEQYRFVTFAPTRSPHPVDWTHEREWRWAARGPHAGPEGLYYLAANYANARGDFVGRVHAFVQTDADISWLQQEVHGALRRADIGAVRHRHGHDPSDIDEYSVPYSTEWGWLLHRARVISLETARRRLDEGSVEYSRFEDWPVADRFPIVDRATHVAP
jgi:hypothetical protein